MYVLTLSESQRDLLLETLRVCAEDKQAKLAGAYSDQWKQVLAEDITKAESLISTVESASEQSEGNSQSQG